MAEKIFKVNDGEEIVIRVPRHKKPDGGRISSPNERGGIIRNRKEDDYLARRLNKKLINFYDLGQILIDGAWQDIFFQIIKDWILGGIPFVEELTETDFTSRDALILGNGTERARRIEKPHGTAFEMRVSGIGFTELLNADNPKWTSSGLRLTGEQLAADYFTIGFTSSFDSTFFTSFILTGPEKNKITASPSPSAESVAFTPQKTDTYYLVPALARSEGITDTNDESLGYPREILQLNYFYTVRPRTQFLAGNTLDHRLLPNARLMKTTQNSFGGAFSYAEALPSLFTETGEFSENEPLSGSLLAIIKQGNQLFYVWS